MANNLLSNPITISALMSGGSYQSQLPAANQRPYLRVRKVQWMGQTSGATFEIQDGAGNLLLQGTQVSADQSYDFADPTIWRDFQVTQLSSGQLSIFLA